MSEGIVEREDRAVHVQTIHGTIDGILAINPKVRTLDELNMASHKFVRLDAARVDLPDCSFEDGSVGISKEAILFVTETSDCHPTTDHRAERSHFVRTALRLRVGDFDVQGFLHIRGLRDPWIWFSQNRQQFLALTAASVVGPGIEIATSFIAVSARHVLAAQEIRQDEPAMAAGPGSTRVEAI